MSPTLSKIYAGHKAKKNGDVFENIFKSMCVRHNISVTRIPNGCEVVCGFDPRIGGPRVKLVKSPWDFVLSYNGRVALLDTKTCSNNFGNSAIDHNQVDAMIEHRPHAIGGYVIWQRDVDVVYFIEAECLRSRKGTRGSINYATDVSRHNWLGGINGFDLRRLFL